MSPGSGGVLVLGAAGMLGHKVWQQVRGGPDAWGTVRSREGLPQALFEGPRILDGVDVDRYETVEAAIEQSGARTVVNCVGVVKQLAAAQDPVTAIAINALFPHRLHRSCRARNARLIHVSTDCVFAGDRGGYRETDHPDAHDLYGRSKLLGEVHAEDAVTLRTSIIGRELRGRAGLVEWFLAHRGGHVHGYRRAVFSGVTTAVLAALIADLIERHPSLSGLYHVAAEPIDKFDLLQRLNRACGAAIDIQPRDEPRIDRSLDGSRLAQAIGWRAPAWEAMIERLASDATPYDEWRQRVS